MVQKRNSHKWRYLKHLHYTSDCGRRQRGGVYGGGVESGRKLDEWSGDIDSDESGAFGEEHCSQQRDASL